MDRKEMSDNIHNLFFDVNEILNSRKQTFESLLDFIESEARKAERRGYKRAIKKSNYEKDGIIDYPINE